MAGDTIDRKEFMTTLSLGFVADSGSPVTKPPALSVAALVWLQTVAFT
jgi:hypothetical protein